MDEKKRGCEECDWRGWVHSHEPFEIQRCDTCAGDDWYDEDAAAAHRKDCGCDWPERDYQHYLLRQSRFESPRVLESEFAEIMERFHETASFRDLLIVNRFVLMAFIGEAYALPLEKREFQDRELENLASTLLEIHYLVSAGKWKPHWLWDFDDGILVDGKWFARKPERRKLPLIQSTTPPPTKEELEYLEKFNEYVEKIRALGATIFFTHDEYNIELHKDNPNSGQVTKLAMELAQFQTEHLMKQWKLLGTVPLKAEADFTKTWEEAALDHQTDFQTPLEQVLRQHAPRLQELDRAMGEAMRRRPKPEVDYKKLFSLLDSADNNARSGQWNALQVNLDEAKAHLLEIYPDADIPRKE